MDSFNPSTIVDPHEWVDVSNVKFWNFTKDDGMHFFCRKCRRHDFYWKNGEYNSSWPVKYGFCGRVSCETCAKYDCSGKCQCVCHDYLEENPWQHRKVEMNPLGYGVEDKL